jgi:hypothetical protein
LYNFLYITFLVETIWGFKIMFQVVFFKKIWKTTSSNQILEPQFISNEKVMNTKVVHIWQILSTHCSQNLHREFEMLHMFHCHVSQVQTRIWAPKWFQLRKWWIPKLFNSPRSKLLYGLFSHLTKFEIEPKFEIESDLNLKCDEYQGCSTNEDLQHFIKDYIVYDILTMMASSWSLRR